MNGVCDSCSPYRFSLVYFDNKRYHCDINTGCVCMCMCVYVCKCVFVCLSLAPLLAHDQATTAKGSLYIMTEDSTRLRSETWKTTEC